MKQFFFIFILMLLVGSCRQHTSRADISAMHVDLTFKSLDDDLFAAKGNLDRELPDITKKYAHFLPVFTSQMIGIGGPDRPEYIRLLKSFVHDTLIVSLKEEADRTIRKDELKNGLETAFRYYRFYFPSEPIPEIYTCVSGFHQSIIYTDSLIGISLDNYLGAECDYYPRLGIPRYKAKNMHPRKIIPDVVYAWGMQRFPFRESSPHLIDRMIYEGKLLYFMDALLPDTPDTLKIGYTQKQLQFCQDREKAMWTYLAEYNLLFSSERMDVRRYVDDAPYTSGFTPDSPGRTGIWLGWQIVKSYLEQHPDISLSQFMADDNYQAILRQSGYQPE